MRDKKYAKLINKQNLNTMNKFYNSIKLTALVLAVVSLAGCQKDTDIFGVTEDIANKTILGYYSYTTLDSTTMQVFKEEYSLQRDNAQQQIGYYRKSTAGQGAKSDGYVDLTWLAVMTPDKLKMEVSSNLKDGSKKNFLWIDGLIQADGKAYEKSISGVSDIDTQNSINTNLENTEFEGVTKAFYEHLEDVKYLAWKTKVDRTSYLPADTAEKKAKYEGQLAQYIDTIVWYLRTQVTEHTLGYVHLDTVFTEDPETHEIDTTYVPVNIVYVDPVPNDAGKHLITYLTSEIKKRKDQVNDRPSSIISSTMAFKRSGDVNTASYTYRKQLWAEECYLDPTSAKAISTDSLYSYDATAWMIPSYAGTRQFDVLLKGKETITKNKNISGVDQPTETIVNDPTYHALLISEFDKNKGKATIGEIKYKMK